jgi:CRP-like cAMP-binding protein
LFPFNDLEGRSAPQNSFVLGQACLSDAFLERDTRAMAMEPTTRLVMQKKEMLRVLREERDFGRYFISYLLQRNVKTEADLVHQLFNFSEKRLARALLFLVRHDKEGSATKKCYQRTPGNFGGRLVAASICS